MSDLLDENLLSFLKDEYKIVKSSPRSGISYIIVIENLISTEHEILKVLDVRKVSKEKIKEYLSALELVTKINDNHNYLVKYSMIKEENGYIYLKMREFIGSLDCEDISIYPVYENMMGKDKVEKKEEDDDEEEEEEEEDDDDENKQKEKKNDKKSEIIKYKGCRGSLRYNAYYDICYSVYLLHSNNLIHGNICKKNIFYYNKHFYLSDYCQYLLHDVDINKEERKVKESKNKKAGKVSEYELEDDYEEDNEDADEEVNDDHVEGEFKSYSDDYCLCYCEKVIAKCKPYVGDKKEDICSLGYVQEHLSKVVTSRTSYDRYEEADEDNFPDLAVQHLWEYTEDGEYNIEKILKKLDKLKVKDWDKEYEWDPETYSCTHDEMEGARCTCNELRKKISELKAKMLTLEKEKEEYIKRITELENEVETLTKGNNELSVKRKKLD